VLSFEVPEEYLGFLRTTDGLEWDGLLIYASKSERTLRYERGVIDGFVEMNEIAQEFDVFEDYVYFAQDGMFLYGYSRSRDQYEIQDLVCIDEKLAIFSSFNDMVTKVLADLCQD
jgi:hypothetical protein